MKAHLIMLLAVAVQAAPGARLSIEGQAISIGTGAPVPHARIVAARVGGTAAEYRTTVASADGAFPLSGLTAGTYRVFAERAGFLRGEHGRLTPNVAGLPVTLVDAQAPASISIAMMPTGVISGRVLDQGRPVRDVWVRAMRATYVNGERSLNIARYVPSDDRGEYRLFDLAPGRYFVSALISGRPRIESGTYVVPTIPTVANGNRREIRTPGPEAIVVSAEPYRPPRIEGTTYVVPTPPGPYSRGEGQLMTPLTRVLQAGDFLDPLVVSGRRYARIYFPATTDATAATPISVSPGAVVGGIDLQVLAR
jgi:hypothetical protein